MPIRIKAKAVLEKWKPGKSRSIKCKWLCPKIPSNIEPIAPKIAPNIEPITPNIAPNIPKVTPINAPPSPIIIGKKSIQMQIMKNAEIVLKIIC